MNEKIKKGDRVIKSPMWKYDSAKGTVIKATKDGWIVVNWDGINGDWYYNESQSKEIKLLENDE